jgi:glucose-1-phosphate cytidylyltransferase
MKVAILAGGSGTRLAEETRFIPKPLVEIGGKPILWHVMRYYAKFGFKEFVIALGYKGELVKKFFLESLATDSPLKIDFKSRQVEHIAAPELDWSVELIDTGDNVLTGGRIKRLQPYLGDSTFMLTWCDGVSNIDLNSLISFHKNHGKLATLTAVHPPSRFGQLNIEGDRVVRFAEKPPAAEGWINGAFYVLEPGVFEYIAGDSTQWEHEPSECLSADGQLMAYRHDSFWQCMDTLQDKELLQTLWDGGKAPWRTWS